MGAPVPLLILKWPVFGLVLFFSFFCSGRLLRRAPCSLGGRGFSRYIMSGRELGARNSAFAALFCVIASGYVKPKTTASVVRSRPSNSPNRSSSSPSRIAGQPEPQDAPVEDDSGINAYNLTENKRLYLPFVLTRMRDLSENCDDFPTQCASAKSFACFFSFHSP